MSLQQTAAEFKAKVQGMLGEKFSIITDDMERVRAAGTVDNALKVGQSAPVFTLPDAFGDQVSLQALLAKADPTFDPVEGLKQQANQVSIISVCNFSGRVIVGL